ncbi:hypothetical protein VTH06DRAFT_7926 [Thermothelomyces fergusii]
MLAERVPSGFIDEDNRALPTTSRSSSARRKRALLPAEVRGTPRAL